MISIYNPTSLTIFGKPKTEPDPQISVDLEPVDVNHTEVPAVEISEGTTEFSPPQPFSELQKSRAEIEARANQARAAQDQIRPAATTRTVAQIRRPPETLAERNTDPSRNIFNGARVLHFTTTDQFNQLNKARHKDQYFVTDFSLHNPRSFVLWYVSRSGQPTQIALKESTRDSFHLAVPRDSKNGRPNGRPLSSVKLSEEQFLCTITQGSMIDDNPENAHFSTSLTAQNLKAQRIARARFDRARRKISADFLSDKLSLAKLNEQVHHSRREFILVDPADFLNLDPSQHAGKYLVLQPKRNSFVGLKLYLIGLDAQRTEIPIPIKNRAAFDQAIEETFPDDIAIEEQISPTAPLREFALHERDFLQIVTRNTMTSEREPATGHYNTSLSSQLIKQDRVRQAQLRQEWNAIGTAFQQSDADARKKNALHNSGARQLHIVSQNFFDTLDTQQRADEYFLIRNDSGNFNLHYITPSGEREHLRIMDGQQRINFDDAIQKLKEHHRGFKTLVLTHTDFEGIITNNTRLIVAGDYLDDRHIDTAHFSTSLEAQRSKARRVRAAAGIIAKKRIENAEYDTLSQIDKSWRDRRYVHAVGMTSAFLIQKYGGSLLDGLLSIAALPTRALRYSLDSVGAQLADITRKTEPYLSAAASYGWYGIRRTLALAANPISVFAKHVDANLSRAVHPVIPHFRYARSLTWYGVNKLGNRAARKASAALALIYHRLAQAGRMFIP